MTRVIHHFRPPDDWTWVELFRYADGKWIPDDGQPDLAFGGKRDKRRGLYDYWPYAVGYDRSTGNDTRWVYDDPHPNEEAYDSAMDFVCSRYHCANGTRVK